MLRDLLLKQFQERLRGLPLRVQTWRGDVLEGVGAKVHLSLHNPKALQVLASPTLGGLARAYVDGLIDLKGHAEDILQFGQALCRADACRDAKGSDAWKWWRHTRHKDRKNIAYHYDVSNDFYGLWLDKNRVYSCAYFETADDDLDSAQEKKLDLICRKLMLKPGERLLDIGCGWGGLILRAAERHGVHATGITLSQEQHDYVREQIRRRGLEGHVDVRLMDYREVPEAGMFDKIASVGMFEHVGRRNLPAYFRKIAALLRPGGLVLNHGITSVALSGGGLGSGISEFIDDYVFPGGELVHAAAVLEAMAAAGLEPLDAENLRPHYGKTLWQWVQRLEANEAEAIRLIGQKKYRIWRIYMAGSAFAFDRNWLALFQILGGKPGADGRQDYPFNRRHVYNA
ncbi:MAG: class I SAM-dependent methyltransferase [Betaproteobacteria bacterium]|nr:class I SAM-dependent methyltransferase [Betaproteobacteria bacterium]